MRKLLFRAPLPALEQLIAPLCYIVLTPIFMAEGQEPYRIWVMAIAFSALSHFMTLGYTAIQVRDITLSSGLDEEEINLVQGNILKFLLILLFSFLLLVFTVGEFGENGYIYFLVCGITISVISEIDKFITAKARSNQRYFFVFWTEIFGRLVWVLLSLAMVSLTPSNIPLVVLISFLGRLICKAIIIYAISLDDLFEYKKFANEPFRASLVYRRTKWIFLQMLGGSMITFADRFVLGVVTSDDFFSLYFPMFQIASLAFTFSASASTVILSSKKTEPLSPQVVRQYWSVLVIACIPSGSLYFFGPALLSAWLTSVNYVTPTLEFYTLNSSFLILSFLAPLHFYFLRLGYDRYISFVNNASGVIYLSAMISFGSFSESIIYYVRFIQPAVQAGMFLYIFSHRK